MFVLFLNTSKFSDYFDFVFPSELEIKDTTESKKSTSYLDCHLKMDDFISWFHFESRTVCHKAPDTRLLKTEICVHHENSSRATLSACCKLHRFSNLNSDSLCVNNHEDQQLSTINLCLFHCAISLGIIQAKYDKGNCCRAIWHKYFIVAEQYYIKECDIRRQFIDPSYYLSDGKRVYFI